MKKAVPMFSSVSFSFFLCISLFFFSYNANAQENTPSLDDYSGSWTNNNSWVDGLAPLATNVNTNVEIYGFISHVGDISFANNYNLTIKDTLIINGNLTLPNKSDLIIEEGGILIIFGDYTSGNTVNVSAGGHLVVTGEFRMTASDNKGEFIIDGGKVYIFDDDPQMHDEGSYSDLNCTDTTDYPESCGFGTEEDIINDPVVNGLIQSGGYSIASSGPTAFCQGDSVTLSVPDEGSYYQWFRDDTVISGANSNIIIASLAGDYSLDMLVSDTLELTPVTVNVFANPSGTLTSDDPDSIVCEGTPVIFTATDGSEYSFMVNGISVQNGPSDTYLTDSLSDGDIISVEVVNENNCSDIYSPIVMTVNPLPVVGFSALSNVCEDATAFDLTQGSPAGGTYSGPGITISPEFDPSVAGPGDHAITYIYTDGNGCVNTIDREITVNTLPVVSFSGLDAFYPVTDPPALLTGDPAGGTFSGTGITDDTFDPSVAGTGTHEIVYEYTDSNACTNSDTLITEVLDYDYTLGAITLTDLDNWYSGDAVYTTIGATADGQVGSCWNYGNDHTRWFKFQATTNEIAATFLTSGSYGTAQRINAAIWEEDAVTQVSCNRYINNNDSVVVQSKEIIPGNWYYISMTTGTGGYRGSFSLRVNDQVDYDYYEGAIELTDITNWNSPNAAYTTLGATSDKNAASCWNTSPNYNRWFRFQATTNTISILVRRGGDYGTIRRINAALWEADGITEVSCNSYISNDDDVYVESVNLTPGEWYYLSVDNNYSGYRGSFSLRIDTRVSYDYKEGAYEIQDLNNWCSPDAFFTTWGATADLSAGSCWNTSPNYNRWFKFTATTHKINVEIKRGGSLGSVRRINAAIWESDGITEITCNRYVNTDDNVSVGTDQLIPGNTYYLSVDNNYSGYRGSFTLCVDDQMDYDYLAGAMDITTLINTCSENGEYTTMGATSDETAPSCWNTSPNYNRWFKFMASTSSINVQLKRGDGFGNIRRAQIALYDRDSSTVLDCNRYVNTDDNVEVAYDGLTPGEWYYIAVDNNYSGYRGTFTLCLEDKPSYDFYEGAIELGILHDWSSSDAAYTTVGATPDKNAASCWNTSPNYNRWFKFTATTDQIHIKINRGGSYGTVRRVNAAIWEADGETEVACKQYVYNDEIVEVEAIDLTPGDTYYLSVDNNYSGYRGTFSLYVNDAVDYDFYEGARDVNSLINSRSNLEEYTTVGATSDKNAGSCWNTSPNYNRWFKFQATTPGMNIKVLRGGTFGSIRRVNIALFNADGTSELACNRYVNNDDIVELDYEGLTPGNWYYFSVDNNYSGYRGTFTLELNDAVSYDYYEGAYELTDIHNWSSDDAEFTTLGATPDKNAGSCWNTSPSYNRWFKFTATTPVINVEVRRGGSFGTVRRINAAIWEEDGITQVACNRYVNNDDNVSLGSNILIPGNTYYISVDNNYSAYRGSFSLFVDDAMDYDFYEGAYEITNLNGWMSELGEFSTLGATPDKNAASCWNTSPNYNRWFKFQAVYPEASVQVLRGGTFGTLRRINLALWDSDGSTELACSRYASNDDNVSLTYSGLTPGNWYYISVDNNYSAYRGSFTLQVNNVSGNEYYAIADGDWSIPETWSLSEGGPPALSFPGNGDVVHIKGFAVTVSGTEVCAELNISTENDHTALNIDGGLLTVNGGLTYTNNGYDFDGSVNILNSGNLIVKDNFVMDRSGGGNAFRLLLEDNSTLHVQNDLKILSSGGSIINNEIIVSGTSSVQIDQDMIIENAGGIKSVVNLNNSAELTVNRDIRFISSTQAALEIELFSTSKINLGRTIQRGVTKYGILACNDNSSIVFGSSDYLQIIPENEGAGSDFISYQNVEVNNTRLSYPQLSLEGHVSIPGTLTLTNGIIQTSTTKLLTIENTGSVSGGSDNSYIEGPFEITGNMPVSFPLGKNGRYQPIAISAPSSATDAYIAEYFDVNPDPLFDTDLHEASIDHVAECEYWTLERSTGTSSVNITAYWDAGTCCISDLDLLKIAVWDGSEWKDYGNGSANGTLESGNISTASPVDLNSVAFTFADHLPAIDFTDPAGPYCESDVPITLSGNPQDAKGLFTGNGITDNGDGTAQFNPNSAGYGTHQIVYYYTSTSGCSNSVIKDVTVYQSPTATILGTDTVCSGTDNEFSIFFTGAAPWNVTYTDGTNSFDVVTAQNPYSFTTNKPGIYSVISLTDANGCAGNNFGSTAELVNWPEPAKPATIIVSGNTIFCEGDNMVLESSAGQIYYWNNGESTQQNIITESGDYWVNIVDDNGCFSENSDTTTVTVNKLARKPSAIAGSDNLCQNNSNTSYSTNSWYADSYSWDLQPAGAGTILGNGSDIEIDWDETFSGVARLSVSGVNANCGTGPVSDTFFISLGALPDDPGQISGDQAVCQGMTDVIYSIAPVANASSYNWTLPANAVFSGASNSNTITVDYPSNAVPGDITVSAINPCGSALNNSSLAVNVQTISLDPSGISKSDDNIYPGDPVTLTVQGGSLGDGASWKWYLDEAFTVSAGADGSTLLVNPSDTTVYWVRAEGSCNITNAVRDTVFTLALSSSPSSVSIDRNNICPGDGDITLSYSGGTLGVGATAEWYDDAAMLSNIGSGNNIVLPAPSSTTTYYVRFEGVSDTTAAASSTLTIVSEPTGTLTCDDPDLAVCEGTSVTFTGSDGINYNFMVNGITAQNGTSDTYITDTLENNDVVSVEVTNENNCSVVYNPITITINALPSVTFSAVADVCADAAAFNLTQGSPEGGTYSGTGASGDTFSPSTAGTGTHTLTYTYTDGNGCTNSIDQTITVNPVPSPLISGPSEICSPGTAAFSTTLNTGNSYSWSYSEGSVDGSETANEITIEYIEVGTDILQVTETIDQTGCSATGSLNLIIYEQPTIGEIQSNNKLTRK